MTWTVVITIVIGIILKMIMSPPSAVVEWIVSKFALHPKLDSTEVTVSYDGKLLDGEEKIKITDDFNNASFLKQYDIFQGNEKLFLHPETNVKPIVINVNRGTKNTQIFVFCYDDYVDVVKQYKKKVVSYRLSSVHLQNFARLNGTKSKLFSQTI